MYDTTVIIWGEMPGGEKEERGRGGRRVSCYTYKIIWWKLEKKTLNLEEFQYKKKAL